MVRVASTRRARLLGLAGLREPPRNALLLPRTRSIHTFGMCFPLDLIWIDKAEQILRMDRNVPPNRVRTCRTATAVIERAGPQGPALRTKN
jgi:uncharacterized membrane protein (UPF0127 family)